MTSDVKKYVKLVLLHVKDDGSVEVIPFTMGQNNVVTFKADEFSYYAFAGVEKQPVTDSEVTDTNNNAPTSPKTGDNRTKKKNTRMIFTLRFIGKRTAFVKNTSHNLSMILQVIEGESKTKRPQEEMEWLRKYFDDLSQTDRESDSFRYPFHIVKEFDVYDWVEKYAIPCICFIFHVPF